MFSLSGGLVLVPWSSHLFLIKGRGMVPHTPKNISRNQHISSGQRDLQLKSDRQTDAQTLLYFVFRIYVLFIWFIQQELHSHLQISDPILRKCSNSIVLMGYFSVVFFIRFFRFVQNSCRHAAIFFKNIFWVSYILIINGFTPNYRMSL